MTSIPDKLFEHATTASSRARKVLLTLQLFGLLIAVVLINSAGAPWISTRIHVAEVARLLYYCGSRPGFVQVLSNDPRELAAPIVSDSVRRAAYARQWATRASQDNRLVLLGISNRDYREAADFILRFGFSSSDVENRLQALLAFSDANVMSVSVPLTTARIDINDFGILVGLGMLILLPWLALSIRAERGALSDLSTSADHQRLAAMSMLFVPASVDSVKGPLGLFMKTTIYAALAGPMLLAAGVIANDLWTVNVSDFLGSEAVRKTIALEVFLGLVNACLIVWCIGEFRRVDKMVRSCLMANAS